MYGTTASEGRERQERAEGREERTWTDVVARLSAGVGGLYFVGYAGYVVIGWDAAFYLPAVILLGYLLSETAIADLWRCVGCGRAVVSRRCPTCGVDPLGGTSALRAVGLYAVVVPSGAIVAEFVLLLCEAIVFSAFGWVPVVAWYQRQWLDAVGFVGPFPGLLYTLFSAMVVALVAVTIRTVQAGATSLLVDQ